MKTTTVNPQPAASTPRVSGGATFDMAFVSYPAWQNANVPYVVYVNPGSAPDGAGVTLGDAAVLTVAPYSPGGVG